MPKIFLKVKTHKEYLYPFLFFYLSCLLFILETEKKYLVSEKRNAQKRNLKNEIKNNVVFLKQQNKNVTFFSVI